MNETAAQILFSLFHLLIKVKEGSWMDDLALNQWVSLEKGVYNRPLNSKLIFRVIKTHYYTVCFGKQTILVLHICSR